MRGLMGLVAGCLGVLAVGCTTSAVSTAHPEDCRVTIAADLASDMAVTGIRCVRNAGGFLEMQANVVNRLSSDRGIEWRIVWLDANGIEIPSAVSNWTKRMVTAMDFAEVRNVAPSQNAADFRFHLRRLRN